MSLTPSINPNALDAIVAKNPMILPTDPKLTAPVLPVGAIPTADDLAASKSRLSRAAAFKKQQTKNLAASNAHIAAKKFIAANPGANAEQIAAAFATALGQFEE